MQSTSCNMPGWMKDKLESRLPGESQRRRSLVGCRLWGRTESDMTEVTQQRSSRYAEDTILTAESEEELKSFLMKVKEESEKAGLKFNIQKMKIVASGPSLHDK